MTWPEMPEAKATALTSIANNFCDAIKGNFYDSYNGTNLLNAVEIMQEATRLSLQNMLASDYAPEQWTRKMASNIYDVLMQEIDKLGTQCVEIEGEDFDRTRFHDFQREFLVPDIQKLCGIINP